MPFFSGLNFSSFQFTCLALGGSLVSALAALLLAAPALRHGLISKSRRDRFGVGKIPLTGGPALFLGIAVTLAVVRPPLPPVPLALAAALFLVGFLDDLFHLRAAPKFAMQAAVAGVGALLLAPSAGMVGLYLLVLLFLVNASNYLDNMDALLPGVALAQALCLMQVGTVAGMGSTLLVWALPGVLLFTLAPARLYLGDSGSHLIGALLALDALELLVPVGGDMRTRLVVPLLLLFAVPLADVATVTVSRLRRRRPLFRGGIDHLSHRLVRFGYSVPGAVLVLVLASAVCGIASLILARS